MKKTEQPLLNLLNRLQIPFEMHRHPPLFTVEESQALRGGITGGHCKCLFVRDKKRNYALFVVDENITVNLKQAAKDLELGRLSFGKPEKMKEMLGVTPGSVTPFSLLNSATSDEGKGLRVILDTTMLEKNPIHFHPLHNEATLGINPLDLLRFITHLGFKAELYDFSLTKTNVETEH